MARITILSAEKVAAGTQFSVQIADDVTMTEHTVTITPAEHKKYSEAYSATELLTATLQYLLHYQAKEAIWRQFSLSDVETEFPDYPEELSQYLPQR